jgi:RimJ/RimL family protein N-acetyltransferase
MTKPRLELSGTKVLLREFGEEHLYDDAYLGWLRDLRVMETINRIEYVMPIRFETIENYVRSLWSSPTDAFFAILVQEGEHFVGTQRLAHIDWRVGSAEVGVMIGDRSVWNQGLAKDAVTVACRYAFDDLGLRRLTAGTPDTNVTMRSCFERLGFKEEGRLRRHVSLGGKMVDRILFGLFPEEFSPWYPDSK